MGADGLALHGQLNLVAFDRSAERGIELVGAAASPGGRAAAAVEEMHFDSRRPRYPGDVFLRLEDRPVRGHIAAVLGAVGKAEHHGLLAIAPPHVFAITRVAIQAAHDFAGLVEIGNGFEQGHDVDSGLGPAGTAQQRQQARDVERPTAIADDIAMAGEFAVALLDLAHPDERIHGVG